MQNKTKTKSESLVHDISNRVQVLVGRSSIFRMYLESNKSSECLDVATSLCDDIDSLVEYIEVLRSEVKARQINQEAA